MPSRERYRVLEYLNRAVDGRCLHNVAGFRRLRHPLPCRKNLPKVVTAGVDQKCRPVQLKPQLANENKREKSGKKNNQHR